MKATCVKSYLKEAVQLCEKISGKNLTLPILSSILISADDNSLKLSATNLEIGLEIEMPAKVEKKGKLAVPANIISGFLGALISDDNIKLEAQNKNLFISTRNSSTLIKGQAPDDFPFIPKSQKKNFFEIPSIDFISGLKSVWYAVSFSLIKPEIASVYVNSGKNAPMAFVATDSFRLAEKKLNFSLNEEVGALVPHRSVAEIVRIFDGRDGKIKIILEKNQIFVVFDKIRFVSRLTEGIFPDYQQIIPKKFSTDVIVDKDVFSNALRAANIFSGKLNELKMIIGTDNGSMTLNTSSADAGEHTATIPAKITGEEIKMAFNSKYVFECIPHIASSQMLLRFSGEGKPILITGTDNNSFQYLVMPMSSV